jgi:hypothetical protein
MESRRDKGMGLLAEEEHMNVAFITLEARFALILE